MKVQTFVKLLGAEFFTGVPDSQLKALCDYLVKTYGTDGRHHIIAANEGNSAAIASGYHLATGKVPVVYMQNSGEGNIINPVASLMNDKVYAVPCIFVIGWRGEPNVHDEPQHIYQGEVTLKLLEDMDIAYTVLDKSTDENELEHTLRAWQPLLARGKQVAVVVRKGALSYDERVEYGNAFTLGREDAIKHIVAATGDDPIISTTGKASRELFEIREERGEPHKYDFLTVGSMGHSSSVALGVALNKPRTKVWCIDGDGAALMHMGAMAVIGAQCPNNLVHIVINNGAHETVGGMPTAAKTAKLTDIAEACGYKRVASVADARSLDAALAAAKKASELTFIEVMCAVGSRADLGRPTTTAAENKNNFKAFLESKD
ncbi:MAG: phosphonopyruvate decarboxylase [Roseburia sp.]|nr:phosphonopyruvate decarboxylase [Roseburia sp.]